MIRVSRWIAVAALLLTVTTFPGCIWGSGGGGTETTPMHGRFSRTVDIQTGVVLGRMDRAREAAAWIAEAETEGSGSLAAGAEAYEARLKETAGLIAQDREPAAAAVHTAQMAAVCGSCHLATGGGPRFVAGSEPDEGSTIGKQMIRHVWASDRMWEGLVGPSDEMWSAGTRVLEEGAETLEGAARASLSPEASRRTLAELRNLGRTGAAATTQEARASVYGRLLGTCYGCHHAAGITGGG
jgi:cytochrome c553